MKKEERDLLIKAWELEHKILREIRDLAEMNYCLAYGCVRTAETIIDFIAVSGLHKVQQEEAKKNPTPKE